MKLTVLTLLAAASVGMATPGLDCLAVDAASTGGGHYFISTLGLEMQFGYSAIVHADGGASGRFHHQGVLEGLSIDFDADVTCLSVDPVNHRAWVGGVITRNDSEHPSFQTPVHQVGHDIWFRVLDNGPGQSDEELDRTTFIGFEGVIPSSQFYCDTMPWPPNNERTWPMTGNLTVRP